jgi:hypothetical protein
VIAKIFTRTQPAIFLNLDGTIWRRICARQLIPLLRGIAGRMLFPYHLLSKQMNPAPIKARDQYE